MRFGASKYTGYNAGMKKLILTLLLIAIAGGSAVFVYKQQAREALLGPDAPETTSLEDIETSTPSVKTEDDTDPLVQTGEYPETLNIEMPFYTQAPHSNWDYPWQEACEEASVLLVANLYNEMNLDLEAYNTELLRLVDWEIEVFGAYEHTTVAQTVEMIETNYGLETQIHEYPSFEDIQAILNKGHLIIAPFAGKYLYNPNFKNGGPIYHMAVIKGYDAMQRHIVTHDVGTRNGANYVYSWEVIENALHDWHDDDILLGTPSIIEVIAP
jgi:hypothetical protein